MGLPRNNLTACLEARERALLRALEGEQHNDFAKDYNTDNLTGRLAEVQNTLNMLVFAKGSE